MKLKAIIKEFTAPFGIKVCKGYEWEAYENEVHYPDNPERYNAEGFMEVIERIYPDIKASEFTWSLLHEIGHAKTWRYFTKKAWKKYAKTAPYIHDIEEYFRIPQERVATDWAADYIRKHPKKIKKFEKKLQKALDKKGYKLYN